MGEVKIKSGNFFDVNGEHTSIVWDGKECLVIENDAIIVNQIRPGYMTGIYYDEVYKPGTYTFAMKQLAAQSDKTAISVVSSAPFAGGVYNDAYKAYAAALIKHDDTHYITIVVTEPTEIGFFINGYFSVNDKIYDIQLLEGTYTSETIPEYQPYFLNRPAHQVTNGQFVDIPTHHFINNRWQGELTSQSPLKFWADGEMLDWRVEGRTSGNLFDGTLIPTTTLGVTFRLDNNGYMYASPTNSDTRGWTYANSQIKVTLPSGNYTLCLSGTPSTSVNSGIRVNDDANKNLAYKGAINGQSTVIINFAVTDNHNIGIVAKIHDGRFRVQILKGTYTTQTIPPYEPYGGVGARTENLFGTNRSGTISTVSAVCNGSEIAVQSDGTNILVSATAPVWKNNFSINLSAGNYGYKIERTGTTTGIISSLYDADNALVASSQVSGTFTLSEDKSIYIGFFIPANTTANGTIKLTIVEGSTAPASYIPYGYKIPVTVNDTTTNIYTDHQLMDGDSIDYATDQTQIPIATGNNTLTVDTAVQPSKVFVKFEG